MINVEADRCILLFLFIDLLSAVQNVTTEKRREGDTVALHSNITELQTGSQVLWSFGQAPPYTPIAQLFRGEIFTDYDERLRDRLQLDRQTGSLTISNLNTNDSGIYQLQIITGKPLYWWFHLYIYTPVSETTNRKSPQSRSMVTPAVSKSCSVLCSVENGREVTLSWQTEGETLNHTSSPDLNTLLSLPLEIEEYSSTYSCVAANPVSHTVTKLNMRELCPHVGPDTMTMRPDQRNIYMWPIVAISAVLTVMIIGSAIVFKKQQKNRKTGQEYDRNRDNDSPEITYAEVQAQPTHTQLSGGAHNGTYSETEDSTVYAAVVT
ncbi:CD48 antigen-like isoform X2 [Megalops cyprinoides]|uniref:CD48 antigen-like isoform X2 n=1 Tax=Megalops cyprinoides TaxID=118141 RepID=UPI0018642DD8|nr:CD48 antigen-like isoform X2 [Megalops cyprinoides]